MSRERQASLPEIQPLKRPRRFASLSQIVGRMQCLRFSEPSGRGEQGRERSGGIVRYASLSAARQLSLITSTIYLGLLITNVSCLTCNCNGTNECNPINGFCEDGCAPGWFGAGCQVGNMAYRKNASQSSTDGENAAEKAVDGFTTQSSRIRATAPIWWSVILSQDDDIVITNVTIVGNFANVPRNLSVLYTNDSSNSTPHPSNWTLFASGNLTSRIVTMNASKETLAIGKRVAIYVNGGKASVLRLDEVYVYGFPLSVRPTIINASWLLDHTCNTINVTALNFNVLNLWPSAVVLFGDTTEGIDITARMEITSNTSGFSFAVFATSNLSYQLWITPEICLSDIIGDTSTDFTRNNICLPGVSSAVEIVRTSSRIYEAWTNGSCLLISVRSPTAELCDLPISITARCATMSLSSNFTDDGIAMLCEFRNVTKCEMNVTLSNNITEVNVVTNILREPTTYIANWSATYTCDYVNVRLNDLPLGSELHLIYVFANDSGEIRDTQQFATINGSRAMEFRIPVNANRTYAIGIRSLLCLTSCWDLNRGGNCSFLPEKNCITTARSNVSYINTRSRVYEAWANNSCILVVARSPSEVSCDLPTSLSVRCANTTTMNNFTENGVALVCGFNKTTSCTVNATLSTNVREVSIVRNISKLTASISSWSAEPTCDNIKVTINNATGSGPTTVFTIFLNDSRQIQTQIVMANGSYSLSTAVPAAQNRSYDVWISLQRCFTNCTNQINRTECSLLQESSCLTITTSTVKSVKTMNRIYEALRNRSCVITRARSEPLCENRFPVMLQCGQFNSSEKIQQNSTTMFCGFPNDVNSSCTAFVTNADGKIQSYTIASSEVVSKLSDTLWNMKSDCDFVSISVSNISSSTPIYAIIHGGEGDITDSMWTSFTDISVDGINATFPADPKMTFQLVIAQCVENITCSTADHKKCTLSDSCLTDQYSKNVATTLTEYRQYDTWANASCIFVSLSSTSSQRCQRPTQLTISCSSAQDAVVTNDSTFASLCNLLPETLYDCRVVAFISNGHIENRSALVLTTSLPIVTITAGQIAGAAIGSLLLSALIACFIFVVLRRYNIGHKHKNGILQCICNVHTVKETGVEAEELTVDDAEYANLQGMSLPEFYEYAQNDELICLKYEKHVPRSSLSCDVGRDEKNKSKNKFLNIIPYDKNRVVLKGTNDYINASYMNGYFKKRKYIATQGPTLNTIEDFWLMIWQQNVSTIVMLTDFVENAKRKCETYFPVACSGDSVVQVNVHSQKKFDCHVVTVLNITMGHETRTITHHHMLAWKDHSIPDHCAQLLLFYTLISDLCQQSSTITMPTVVVHCSAGAGRTGTLIAFDWLLHCANNEKRIDVDRCVKALREQRMQSVQTKDQYLFLHKAVLYGLKTQSFTCNADFLSTYVKKLSPDFDSTSAIDDEWQVLSECRHSVRHLYDAANKPENRSKNRSLGVLPTDAKRVYIQQEGESSCDYINAVYCNGCYCDKSFVVTQIPLQSTVKDFWTMAYGVKASCIVLMHPVPDDEEYAGYYPACGQSITVGRFKISNDSRSKDEHYSDYNRFELLVSISPESRKPEEDELKVKFFVLSKWDINEATPKDVGSILALMTELKPYCQDSLRRPVIVQCRDGASHSGLFVCAANALHRLIETNQVQVFHSVDLARSSRPEFIASKEQYLFIYHMLLQHHETSAVYANA